MKKTAFLLALSALLVFAPLATAYSYDRDITIPTAQTAVIDGKIKSKINIESKTSTVNPWMYVDIKLDETKSDHGKFNYAELALRKAFGFFTDHKYSLKDGDFYIILNNGFVINKQNYKDKKVTDMAMQELLKTDFYRGDTLFKLAFLYHDNAVQRTTYWKLIDAIDLPAGSTHTLTKKYTSGITKNEELKMGQTLGLKLVSEVSGSIGGECSFASAKIMASLTGELNKTASKSFTNNQEIKSTFESNTNISYQASNIDKVILRYQLVDNYKVDPNTFKDATNDLQNKINIGGPKLVKIVPSAGEEGVDVSIDQIFDVTINK